MEVLIFPACNGVIPTYIYYFAYMYMYIDTYNLFNLNKKKLYVKLHNSSTTESKDNENIDFSSLRILSGTL